MKVIQLEAKRLGIKSKIEKINGVEFHVALSPYFFPERLECRYDKNAGCFTISFRYLDNEPPSDIELPDDEGLVTLSVGKLTGRLLEVRVHVDKYDVSQIKIRVTEDAVRAIQKAQDRQTEMTENYEAAQEALREHGDEIAELVPA